jgi:hypothetical protein
LLTTVRFLLLRILIYRPVFVQLCQRSSLSQQPSASTNCQGDDAGTNTIIFSYFAQRCSMTCIEAAQELIDLQNQTSQTVDTGAWWYNLYCQSTPLSHPIPISFQNTKLTYSVTPDIFTSAMVLALADLCPSVRETIDNDALARSWQQCQDTLSRMTEYGSVSRQYFKILQVMHKMVRLGGQRKFLSYPQASFPLRSQVRHI